jgi:hypothetical protein
MSDRFAGNAEKSMSWENEKSQPHNGSDPYFPESSNPQKLSVRSVVKKKNFSPHRSQMAGIMEVFRGSFFSTKSLPDPDGNGQCEHVSTTLQPMPLKTS